MRLWKQLLSSLALAVVALAAWLVLSPSTLPEPFARAAALLEPGGGAAVETTRERERAGPRGPRGGRGGGRGEEQVLTREVASVAATQRVQSLGTAEAGRSVTLFPQTAGLVTEVLFRAGERVAAGQPLLRLDDREQAIAVEQAQIRLKAAEDQLERFRRLERSQAVTAVQIQDAEAAVATAQTEVAAADLALQRRTLRAPFAGFVGLARLEEGDMATTTSPVTNLDDRSTILVAFAVPERFAAMATRGTAVTATTAAHATERFTGEVRDVDSRIDPQTRTLTLRAAIPNGADRLRPGMSFAVGVEFPGEPQLAVPPMALQWDREGAFVWKVEEGRVKRLDIAVVARTADAVLVNGELSVGDTIVVEGVQRLRDGAGVTVVEQIARGGRG